MIAAAFRNELNDEIQLPNVIDEPKTMEEVFGIAGQFIVSDLAHGITSTVTPPTARRG